MEGQTHREEKKKQKKAYQSPIPVSHMPKHTAPATV